MKNISEHEYTTYPRRFNSYRWYKPILVFLLFVVIFLALGLVIDVISKTLLGFTDSSGAGYDGMDFFTPAGAFHNGAQAAIAVPAVLLAALIVKDRPLSSYFSSMGGWRWKVFLKTFAAAFVILGIPTMIWYFAHGKVADFKLTFLGTIILALFLPFQGLGEELQYRSFITQTVSSWFMIPIAGVIAQIVFFTIVHPYNIIGMIEIAISAIIYALTCVITKGIEAPTALHIINNSVEIFMAGLGYGLITSEQNVPSIAVNLILKILFFAFIIFANKKLHWFREVKRDDVAEFNAKLK